mmetsp:Transcript_1246/g.5313  ORF Transcript_1246/g.5313 Transcript_1246/m.5313 type:complete len:220 (-) Transcript_1246:577-1236(-)
MSTVFAFPPSESCSTRVSLESRYGTCAFPSQSALMTLPKALRLRLIICASFSVCPDACVLLRSSLPAKSTRYIRPVLDTFSSKCSTVRMKMLCDRLLSAFMRVAATALFWLPSCMSSSRSWGLLAYSSVTPSMKTPLEPCSRIFRPEPRLPPSTPASGLRRSWMRSRYSSTKLARTVNSAVAGASEMWSKTACTMRGITPAWSPEAPIIVCVLPEPVWP